MYSYKLKTKDWQMMNITMYLVWVTV